VPQNGAVNEKFGVYKSVCCGAEIVITAGATFPDCPNHQKLTHLEAGHGRRGQQADREEIGV